MALQCLTEIISLDAVDSQQYSDIILNIYAIVYKEMIRIIPESSNIARLYTDPSTNEDDQHFIELLAIFITTTLEKYRALIEKTEDGQSTVHASLVYLLEISRVPEQEVWKICLEYWGKLVLYHLRLHEQAIELIHCYRRTILFKTQTMVNQRPTMIY